MEWSELREKRAEAIESMNKSLFEVKQVDLPAWALRALMLPVFIGLALYQGVLMGWTLLRIWVGLLAKVLMAPFFVFFLFGDIVILLAWFISLVVEKMIGGNG